MPDGTTTATSLLDAAEAHFADEGFQRASLRAVMRTAGADPGAIHYHFGGRPALAAAVLDRLLAPLNARRLDLLDAAIAGVEPDPVPVRALVDALIRPDLELAADLERKGPGRARLVGLIYLEPEVFVTERVEAHFAPVAQRFLPELRRAVPLVAPDDLAWRVRWIVFGTLGAILAAPNDTNGVSGDLPADAAVDGLADRVVPSLAAALDPDSGRGPESDLDSDPDLR